MGGDRSASRYGSPYEDHKLKVKKGDTVSDIAFNVICRHGNPCSQRELSHFSDQIAQAQPNGAIPKDKIYPRQMLFIPKLAALEPNRDLMDRELKPPRYKDWKGHENVNHTATDDEVRERQEVIARTPSAPRDEARPYLTEFGAKNFRTTARALANSYARALRFLEHLGRDEPIQKIRDDEKLGDFAERMIKSRNAFTGELVTKGAIQAEAIRIVDLNAERFPELKSKLDRLREDQKKDPKIKVELSEADLALTLRSKYASENEPHENLYLSVYNKEFLEKLDKRMVHFHIPPVGQFFKAVGLTDDDLDEAQFFQDTRYAHRPGEKDLRPLFPVALKAFLSEQREVTAEQRKIKNIPSEQALGSVDVNGNLNYLDALLAKERSKVHF
jgi:hypothetical protein